MKYLLFSLCFICLTACSSVPRTPEGFEKKTIETEHFSITVWEKENMKPGLPLFVYIEGDGNPAPEKATALLLASKDPRENVIYVSRPCQYQKNKICSNSQIWKEYRFHPEIIKEMEELVVFLSRKYKTPELELIGYDGGATIALLLASKMPVKRVITIGGILDTDAYTHENNLPDFPPENLNPVKNQNVLSRVEQIHYVGSNDKKTTKRMAERFVARLRNPRSAVVKVVPKTTHDNWEKAALDYY